MKVRGTNHKFNGIKGLIRTWSHKKGESAPKRAPRSCAAVRYAPECGGQPHPHGSQAGEGAASLAAAVRQGRSMEHEQGLWPSTCHPTPETNNARWVNQLEDFANIELASLPASGKESKVSHTTIICIYTPPSLPCCCDNDLPS